MPIKQTAYKAVRQIKKRTLRNRLKKDAIKDLAKKVKKFLAEKKVEEAKKLMPLFYKAADKAAKTRVITKNKAARLKSRLMIKLKG